VSIRAALVAIALQTVAGSALGAEVYINGVKVTGAIKNTELPKVQVRFDAQGNVHIAAPGYKIEVVDPTAHPTPVAATAQRPRYWVIVNMTTPGHYAVRVLANGQMVGDVATAQRQYVSEITDKLQLGTNAMLFTFLPTPSAPYVPPTEAVDILVGEGHQDATGTLTIDKVLGTMKRQTGSRSAEARPLHFEIR